MANTTTTKLVSDKSSDSLINTLEGLKLSEETLEVDDLEDRISSLPDCLIIDHILSRLPLTKHAIRTGVLSKRWQHLWPQNPNLNLTVNLLPNTTYKGFGLPSSDVDLSFLSGVHQTISQCRQLNLNEFKLEAYYDFKFESEVNDCISFAVSRNVKSLDITLLDNDKCHLVSDESVFINSSFIHLVLKNCILKPTGAISWSNLRSLCITLCRTDEDLIQNILSGSPVLETLELHVNSGYHYSRIDISSKSVKKLVLEGCRTRNTVFGDLEINAPNILSLTIRGILVPRKYLLQNVSSLAEAELDFEIYGFCFGRRKATEDNILLEFIDKLYHVEKLTIRNQCLKALFRLEAKIYFPSCLIFDVTSPYFYDDGSVDSLEEEVHRLYGSGKPLVPPNTRKN